MKTIFVTGCGGFVGAVLVRRLLEEGFAVRGMVKPGSPGPAGVADTRFELQSGDLLDEQRVRELMAGCDMTVHCAAVVPGRNDPEYTWEVNVEGTRHIVNACLEHDIERLVHISTDSIYGDGPTVNATEDSVIDTDYYKEGNYPRSKLAAEEIVARCWSAAGKDSIVLRPCMIYGPGPSSATEVFREWGAVKCKILLGGGKSRLSAVYVDDLVEAIVLAVKSSHAAGVYNISDGRDYSKREIIDTIAAIRGRRPWLISLPGMPFTLLFGLAHILLGGLGGADFRRRLDPRRIRFAIDDHTVSCAKAIDELGYSPQVFLEQGLQRTFAWIQRQD